MPAESREQNGNSFPAESQPGTQIRADSPTEDKALIQTDRQENQPTKILADEETGELTKIFPEAENEGGQNATDENSLKPSRARFALVLSLLVLMGIFGAINARQIFL